MILADIKAYLSARPQATLNDIALHLDADPEAVRGMLSVWIRKGKVRKLSMPPACSSSCSQCMQQDREVYAWSDGVSASISVSNCYLQVN